MKIYDDGIGQMSFDNMEVKPLKVSDRIETLDDRIQRAYKALKLGSEFSHEYYGKPLIICYSGGKDSDVCLALAEECLGTDFEVIHSHTTVDAPQTVKHIEKVFARLESNGIKTMYRNRFPVKTTMWDLIKKKKFPPTRIIRYCCRELKETSTQNRIAVLGVRGSESANRKGREVFGVRGGVQRKVDFIFRLTTQRKCIVNRKR